MIAVASFKPLDASMEVAVNQVRAKKSWDKAFDAVVYFGKSDERLYSPKTTFIESDDFPTISLMALTASMSEGWAAIINSDILVSPVFPSVVDKAVKAGAKALTSFRYQYDPNDPDLSYASVVDNGFDFFAAIPSLWKQVSQDVPPQYRIGHNCWDSWMLGFFNTVARRKFFDITRHKCIFHPKHGDRKQVWDIGPVEDRYSVHCAYPFMKL